MAKNVMVREIGFPKVLKEWLKHLPPDDKVREYGIAKVNLNRIARHMQVQEAEQIHFS